MGTEYWLSAEPSRVIPVMKKRVIFGLLMLFGLMGLLNIPLNPANMIVLPLILGIGIDDGVHVVHDFRRQAGRYRLSSSTATAVLITSLTTMVGFGSLMTAHHQGLQSLGRVLTIGVICCLLSSVVILPALLCWLTRDRFPQATEDTTRSSDTADSGTKIVDSARTDPPHRDDAAPHTRGERRRRSQPLRVKDSR